MGDYKSYTSKMYTNTSFNNLLGPLLKKCYFVNYYLRLGFYFVKNIKTFKV